MESGLLGKICSFVMWWKENGCCDDLHKVNAALLICLLGPGDVPGAVDKFLQHGGVGIVVRASVRQNKTISCPKCIVDDESTWLWFVLQLDICLQL